MLRISIIESIVEPHLEVDSATFLSKLAHKEVDDCSVVLGSSDGVSTEFCCGFKFDNSCVILLIV